MVIKGICFLFGCVLLVVFFFGVGRVEYIFL